MSPLANVPKETSMTNLVNTAPPPAAKHRSHWILWWQTDPAEIQKQVAEYAQGWVRARHVAAYCLTLSVTLTTAAIYAQIMSPDSWLDVVVMATLAGFIFFGHRWAMIGGMLWWTFEKGFGIVNDPPHGASVIPQLIWWAVYMHAFWVAFQVEQERRKPRSSPDETARIAQAFGRPCN
jgi:hypothetical protein